DHVHYRGDLLTNLAVLAALVASRYTDAVWIDPVVGIAIAAFFLVNALRIGGRALDVLMDRELPTADRARIQATVLADPRVRGLHDLRSRRSGTGVFIELHLELDGDLT